MHVDIVKKRQFAMRCVRIAYAMYVRSLGMRSDSFSNMLDGCVSGAPLDHSGDTLLEQD